VPTLSELGFDGYPTVSWVGIMAPGGTPQAIVNRLNAAINDILKSAAMRASLMRLGFDAQIMSQEEFAGWIASDEAKWAEVVKLTGAVGE
jgi:tripartite-type tricarboxylate transporter receptor subunit TctC